MNICIFGELLLSISPYVIMLIKYSHALTRISFTVFLLPSLSPVHSFSLVPPSTRTNEGVVPMWSWEAASRGLEVLEPLWSWQEPDRRGKEEKTVKVEEKLKTEKSSSESEMLARKDYIPFNR